MYLVLISTPMHTQNPVGRPRKFTSKPLYFGMKITKEEKEKIQKLSATYNKPAAQVILSLVEKACMEQEFMNKNPKKISASKLRRLPKEERAKILNEQAEYLSQFPYEIIQSHQPIIDY